MKRYVLKAGEGDQKRVCLEEVEEGPLEDRWVKVRMEACSLNYRDLLMKSGLSASSGDEPVVPLSDGAGVVEEVGESVSEFAIGDRVALTFFRDWQSGRFDMKYHQAARGGSCDGTLAENVMAPARSLVAVPDFLSPVEAATLPCAAVTAWHALFERCRPLQAGDTVLCLGTGGVSIFGLQLAKAAGARVIVTSSSDEKLERARELGADDLINYRSVSDWDKKVFDLTDRRGVDHVLEVGGPGTLEKSMNSVSAGGSIALIGVLTGFSPPESSLFPLVARNVNLSGIYVGSREMFERLLVFMEQYQIKPIVDQVFGFDDASAAYAALEGAGHFGKIAIEV
ncbi:MAG: NAD(P)-dependent alcohol dehydrogenase [Verrucomicrobiota bacterium]